MDTTKPLGYILDQSLRVIRNQMISEFRKKEIDLTIEQFVILHMLNSDCELIQRDLAHELNKDKSIIVRQINYLLKNQYITGRTNNDDKRKKNLILTEKGSAILAKMKAVAHEVSEKLLTGVAETELEIFQKVLKQIQANGGVEEVNC